MTKNYMTPQVIHIQETDCDGNISVVRYYRESLIEEFVTSCFAKLGQLRTEADATPAPRIINP